MKKQIQNKVKKKKLHWNKNVKMRKQMILCETVQINFIYTLPKSQHNFKAYCRVKENHNIQMTPWSSTLQQWEAKTPLQQEETAMTSWG